MLASSVVDAKTRLQNGRKVWKKERIMKMILRRSVLMQTAALKKCMEAHSYYYAPLLQAEKGIEEEKERSKKEYRNDVVLGQKEKEVS
ncbi:hypothetical protein BUALT_Bualt17G0073300 [Buddleja alternifolia]|uniref:GCK domain-containing protein n=1 Tax=Buddleja alternifolia TaxID=168488 RepID=A0AAV6WEG9_9LAMI|nr:hypothetical protein BUALT_Bualt17G0073300 [Buddleja alternifolia]